jgi:hypothetical protein
MNKIIRTVRFSAIEIKRIDEFLKQNSFLDFSNLARMAINHFIENPTVQIKAVKQSEQKTVSKNGDQNVNA